MIEASETAGTIGERIVVVEDGGPTGRAAVRWVAERLGRHPADVRVIGTLPRADDEAVIGGRWVDVDHASSVLRTVAPHASLAAEVLVGDPVASLRSAAETADLLVIGVAPGVEGRTVPLGTELAARASCVVVVVPVEWAPGGGVTVVGASIDAASDAAIAFAAEHARSASGILRLVHAWDLPATGELRLPEREEAGSIPDVQRRALEAFAAGVRRDGVEVSSSARQGSPAEVLREASGEAELLVVGRRTRRPLTRLLLGSVSRALVDDPPCPVAVVPQPRLPLRVVAEGRADAPL